MLGATVIGATGSSAASTYRIVNHVVVHSGDLVSALIGGGIVLAGVLVTEVFVRLREKRRRLNEAAWDLQSATRGGLLVGRVEAGEKPAELSSRYAAFMHQLGRIRAEAKWPIRNARKIAAEVDQAVIRLMVATVRSGTQMGAGPPRLGPVVGSKLLPLIFREANSAADLDAALRKEGLPSLADVADYEARRRSNDP